MSFHFNAFHVFPISLTKENRRISFFIDGTCNIRSASNYTTLGITSRQQLHHPSNYTTPEITPPTQQLHPHSYTTLVIKPPQQLNHSRNYTTLAITPPQQLNHLDITPT